ncbi:MAG: hypothetical protein ACP5DX_15590 [Paracoccaceae bacterium]
MRSHAAVLGLALALSAGPAQPGPWPREAGTGFLSLSHSVTEDRARAGRPVSGYSAVYGEFGLGRARTLGLDAGRGDRYGDWSAILFFRRALDDGRGRHRFALEFGLGGMGADGMQSQALLRPGLSWGRGLETALGPGWAALDSFVEYRLDDRNAALKADLTLGLKPRPGQMLILQVQSGDYPGADPYLRLVPSYVRRLGRSGTYLEIGLKAGLAGEETQGLKIGLWHRF